MVDMLWTVLGEAGRSKRNQRYVLCRCVCGTERRVMWDSIRKGVSKSCGCKGKCGAAKARGGKPTPTYVSWQAMRTRCLNPNSADYPRYGAVGITIDPAWDSFECFLQDMGERPVGYTLDRIDVYGNYCKSNCRWATYKQQRHNQRPHKRSVLCSSS